MLSITKKSSKGLTSPPQSQYSMQRKYGWPFEERQNVTEMKFSVQLCTELLHGVFRRLVVTSKLTWPKKEGELFRIGYSPPQMLAVSRTRCPGI